MFQTYSSLHQAFSNKGEVKGEAKGTAKGAAKKNECYAVHAGQRVILQEKARIMRVSDVPNAQLRSPRQAHIFI